jgi:DNA-binding NarL/FixJ family response regulator
MLLSPAPEGHMLCALVIEDHDLMRLGLINEIKRVFGHSIVHGAQTREAASALLGNHSFDLVITDPGLPGIDPTSRDERLALVSEVLNAYPTALHIVITGYDSIEEGMACERLGAHAYIGKIGLNGDRLAAILQKISSVGFCLELRTITQSQTELHYSDLSPREQEIMDYMRDRKPDMKRKDIYAIVSERIGVDEETVKKYYKTARAKLIQNGLYPKGA